MILKRLHLTLLTTIFLFSCVKNQVKQEKEKINPLYEKAHMFLDKGIQDSAFIYFHGAKDIFLQEKDSLGIGKCLVNMAIILSNKSDYFGAQETSLEALAYFNDKKKDHLTYIKSNLNNLGISSYSLKNYTQAISFYEQSLKYLQNSKDRLVVINNIANAYREKNDYKRSLALYENILKQRVDDKNEYARTLTNFSTTKWIQNPNYNAAPELLKALYIREKEDDLKGLTSSYAHLSDYYAQKQPDSALSYAFKMYIMAQNINHSDDQLLALQKLIKLSPPKETKRYFEIYQQLSDSVQTAHSAAKNQFALIRYETEKHKADNLKLQKDNAENKFQIIKQKVLLIGTLVFVLAAAVISIIWYKRRKQRLELEAQNSIRENQLKTSKKVHDVVANGLYRVMTEIENQESINKDHILDKIEDMYEKSRDISYDQHPLTDENFHKKIADLLQSFDTESTKVVCKGNAANLWEKVSTQVKYEVEHILQELMVNMKKHSGASKVNILFKQENNQISINYVDNGIGLPKDIQFKNGLSNTENRIKNISGTITFDMKVEKGLAIHISFPIS